MSDPKSASRLVIPLGDLPAPAITYCLRQTLFKMAEAARKTIHKNYAKALEEAGRGIRLERGHGA